MRTLDFIGRCLFFLFAPLAFVSFAINGFIWLSHTMSYDKIVERAFEQPETEKHLTELFKLIESRSIDSELELEESEFAKEYYKYPKARRLPFDRVLAALGGDRSPILNGEGIAFYDSEDRFLALRLGTSRMGFFLSRSPTLAPGDYHTLRRFTSSDIYITGINSSGGE